MKRSVGALLSLGSMLVLGACGGGGSSAPPAPSVTTFPVAGAISSYVQASHTFNLSTTSNGNTFTAALTYTPGPSATFQGQTTASAMRSTTINQNGSLLASGSDTSYFIASPYQQIGSVNSSGQYTIDANPQPLPATASIGQNGPYDTQTTYSDSTLATPVSTSVNTWSLASASSTTAWLCANSATTPVSGTPFNEADCYQIDASGNVLGLKVTLQVSGQSITFQ